MDALLFRFPKRSRKTISRFKQTQLLSHIFQHFLSHQVHFCAFPVVHERIGEHENNISFKFSCRLYNLYIFCKHTQTHKTSSHLKAYPVSHSVFDGFEIEWLLDYLIIHGSPWFLDGVHKHGTVLMVCNFLPQEIDVFLPCFLSLFAVSLQCGCGCVGFAACEVIIFRCLDMCGGFGYRWYYKERRGLSDLVTSKA